MSNAGSHLPLDDPPFTGTVGRTYEESEEAWPAVPSPPEGAPNVVVIPLDDVGFGQTGTFGGPVPTPELDGLADQGLKYNRFHTTARGGTDDAGQVRRREGVLTHPRPTAPHRSGGTEDPWPGELT